jgi:hypothetical protein
MGRWVVGSILGVPLMAAPMSAGFSVDPKWWLLLPVAIVVQFMLYYIALDLVSERKRGVNPQSEDTT